MKYLKEIIEKYKEKTEKECIAIRIDKNIAPEVFDDKLGGIPYFPDGIKYPKDSKGKPMALLLQIDLEKIKLPNFSHNGILEIFLDNELSWPSEYKFFVFEKGLPLSNDLPKVDVSNFVIPKPFKITVSNEKCIMPFSNYRSDNILNDILLSDEKYIKISLEDLKEEMYDENIDFGPLCSIGGYPDFTQQDPRDEKSNLDICLFKLDSMLDSRNIYIGDSGILNVTISEKDFIKGNFGKANLDWDCC